MHNKTLLAKYGLISIAVFFVIMPAMADEVPMLFPTDYNEFVSLLESAPIGETFPGTLDKLIATEYIPGSAYTLTKLGSTDDSSFQIQIPESDSVYYLKLNTKNGGQIFLSDRYIADHINGGQLSISGNKEFVFGDFFTNTNTNLYSGGVLYLGTNTVNKVSGVFVGNKSGVSGGVIHAIHTFDGLSGEALNTEIKYIQADFINNHTDNDGGAICNNGIIGDVTGFFLNNSANTNGGAIYNNSEFGNITSDFINNHVINSALTTQGGSIYNSGTMKDISGYLAYNYITTNATGNKDIQNTYGGAIYNSNAIDNINGSFSYNHIGTSAFDGVASGGAIYNSGTIKNINGEFSHNHIEQVDNDYNHVNVLGGAIYNTGSINSLRGIFLGNSVTNSYISAEGIVDNYAYGGAIYNTGTMNFDGDTQFIGNSAEKGGAIYNTNTMTFNGDTLFSDNIATDTQGGTIHNDEGANITFNGNTVFTNNQSAYTINNKGNITFSGTLTLDKNIAVSSAGVHTLGGTVIFDTDTVINAIFGKTHIAQDKITFKGNNIINVFVDGVPAEGTWNFINFHSLNGFDDNLIKNDLYKITSTGMGSGINMRLRLKTPEEMAADMPISLQEAGTLSALMQTAGNSTKNNIVESFSNLIQTEHKSEAFQGIKDIAPTRSQMVIGMANSVNNALYNIASNRMNDFERSGGNIWAQGFYNYTKQNTTSDNDGFTGNIKGVALGIDGEIVKDLTIGFGYGYNNSHIDTGNRDINVNGHNVFAYSEYQPSKWYINGMFNYGFNKYDESKTVIGYGFNTTYDVNTYAANLMTGYDFDFGITPEVGLRYLLADQKDYNDGMQDIHIDKTQVLTGIVGTKYTYAYKTQDFLIKPGINLGLVYDFINPDIESSINVMNGGTYYITGKSIDSLGLDAGIGLEFGYDSLTLSLNYNGGFRKDFQSHTGVLKLKYSF